LNGVEVTVRANLEAALRSLRMQNEFRAGLLLWADALCINQNDIVERGKVVRDMQNIYLEADTVTVWLGAGDEKSEYTTQTIRDFAASYAAAPERDGLLLERKVLDFPPFWYTTTVYPAIVDVMDRPYWRRLWIMQEIMACAPCEYVYIGDHKISWAELFFVLRVIIKSDIKLPGIDEFSEATQNRVIDNAKQAYPLLSFAEMYRHSPGIGKWNAFYEIETWSSWIYLGGNAEATDQRDRVYGLLGLLPLKISSRVEPDYSKSVEEVYRDFSRAVLEASHTFDDILVGNIRDNPDMASWAIELRDTSSSNHSNGRASGDPDSYNGMFHRYLKKFLKDEPRNFEDSDDTEDKVLPLQFSDDGTILTAFAIHVATIEGISGTAVRSTTPLTFIEMPWLEYSRRLQLREGTTARETLLRALYGDTIQRDIRGGTLLDTPWYEDAEPDPPMVCIVFIVT
jgi:hypothetical protein